jgi:hypothetical protein
VVAGTAFAVSESLLLSAFHVFEDGVRFFITQGVTRDVLTGLVSYRGGQKHEVTVETRGSTGIEDLDCVVLSVKDCLLVPIPIDKTIPIIEDTVKFYFAYDAVGFNNVQKDSCQIGVNRLQTISTISDHHLHTCSGYGKGTSGGPYIKDGKVVAIHISSSNSIPDIGVEYPSAETEEDLEESGAKEGSYAKARKRRLNLKEVDDKVASLGEDVNATKLQVRRCIDVLSAVSNSHEEESLGVLIVPCTDLCEFLRDKGLDI